jgi:hypothetical protein
MKTGQSWKCVGEECEDSKIYNYRGLCRSCTEYSEDKSVAVAVNRVKVFESGEVMPTLGNTLAHRLTRQDFLNHRRSKRLTKKQLVALEAAHKHTQAGYGQEPDEHIHTEDCEHNHAEITEIGESIEEEE